MLDLVITGGLVVDGTGAEPMRANVGVQAGRIVAVDLTGRESLDARRTIEADGLVVAPGFIDIHTHYDAQVFWDPACTPSSLHGVTTVFCGNCGFSIAPLGDDPTYIMEMLAAVEGIPLAALEAGVPWNWKSFGDYLDHVDAARPAVNFGVSVGHSALRRAVLDAGSHDGAITPDVLAAMRALLVEGLEAGAFGFSSSWGLHHFDGSRNPVPSRFASADELVALSEVLRGFPGAQLEFIPTNAEFEDVHLDVMTRMALAAEASLNWNILIPRDRAWVENRMRASEHASIRGANVVGLSYPDVQTTRMSLRSDQFSSVPGWAPIIALPPEEKLAALGDAATRHLLRRAAEQAPEGLARFETMTVDLVSDPRNEMFRGRRLGEIAAERGQHVIDALLDISVTDGLRTLLMPQPRAADDAAWEARLDTWRDPRIVIGASDGGAHVNTLSTYDYTVRFLARQRELGVLSLAEAVYKLTDVPARLYGLLDRGRLEPGCWADVVMFDADTIAPGAVEWRDDLPAGAGRLYSEPEGIAHVLVAGTSIVEDGLVTGARPGQVLRRQLHAGAT
jgi:N-acyl-D-aspartate/D-glutamate deacylase